MELTVNQFNKGLLSDIHPMMSGNDVLTDALNATFITMNGNEIVLQNDMGNRRIDNAYLPSGYVPVGIKEYGGIIYIAAYNPITNKSQLGSFPSPERKISSYDDEELGGKIDLNVFKNEAKSNSNLCGLNCITTDVIMVPLTKDISLHAGDKFVIKGNSIEDNEDVITNYFNTTESKITSPKNKQYTLSLGILNSQNEFVDITNTLVRWDENGSIIKFDNNYSDLYKFNSGYFIPDSFSDDKLQETMADETLINERKTIAANTYAYKLVGPLYIKLFLNHILNFNYNIYGLANSDSDGKVTGEIWIEASIVYNCPDGIIKSSPLENNSTYNTLAIGELEVSTFPVFDLYSLEDDENISEDDENISRIPEDDSIFTELSYNEISNTYSTKITKHYKEIKGDANNIFKYVLGVRAYNDEFYYISGLSTKGELDLSLLGSGLVKLKGYRFTNSFDQLKGTLTYNFDAYPKFNQEFRDFKFIFTEVEANFKETDNGGTTGGTGGNGDPSGGNTPGGETSGETSDKYDIVVKINGDVINLNHLIIDNTTISLEIEYYVTKNEEIVTLASFDPIQISSYGPIPAIMLKSDNKTFPINKGIHKSSYRVFISMEGLKKSQLLFTAYVDNIEISKSIIITQQSAGLLPDSPEEIITYALIDNLEKDDESENNLIDSIEVPAELNNGRTNLELSWEKIGLNPRKLYRVTWEYKIFDKTTNDYVKESSENSENSELKDLIIKSEDNEDSELKDRWYLTTELYNLCYSPKNEFYVPDYGSKDKYYSEIILELAIINPLLGYNVNSKVENVDVEQTEGKLLVDKSVTDPIEITFTTKLDIKLKLDYFINLDKNLYPDYVDIILNISENVISEIDDESCGLNGTIPIEYNIHDGKDYSDIDVDPIIEENVFNNTINITLTNYDKIKCDPVEDDDFIINNGFVKLTDNNVLSELIFGNEYSNADDNLTPSDMKYAAITPDWQGRSGKDDLHWIKALVYDYPVKEGVGEIEELEDPLEREGIVTFSVNKYLLPIFGIFSNDLPEDLIFVFGGTSSDGVEDDKNLVRWTVKPYNKTYRYSAAKNFVVWMRTDNDSFAAFQLCMYIDIKDSGILSANYSQNKVIEFIQLKFPKDVIFAFYKSITLGKTGLKRAKLTGNKNAYAYTNEYNIPYMIKGKAEIDKTKTVTIGDISEDIFSCEYPIFRFSDSGEASDKIFANFIYTIDIESSQDYLELLNELSKNSLDNIYLDSGLSRDTLGNKLVYNQIYKITSSGGLERQSNSCFSVTDTIGWKKDLYRYLLCHRTTTKTIYAKGNPSVHYLYGRRDDDDLRTFLDFSNIPAIDLS